MARIEYSFGKEKEEAKKPERILIIDDDKQLVQRYKEILEKKYHQIDCAYDGEEGLEKLKKNGADLVILDIKMPKMDGIKVLEAIRDEQAISKTKVLVMSSYTYKPALAVSLGTLKKVPKLTSTGHKARYIGESKAGDFERVKIGAKPKPEIIERLYTGGRDWVHESEEEFQKRQERQLLAYIESALASRTEPLEREKKDNEPDRVLIVDDDKQLVERLVSRLKPEGYELLSAYNGTEALEKIAKEDVDLVILDLNMPETTGEEVIRVMNSIPVVKHIPIIVFTSMPDTTAYKDIFGLSPGMEIIDESNIRSRIRSYKYRISEAYDKPAESKFLSYLHMDKPRALLNKVKEELEERRRLGYGYKKYPVTVLRNKKGKWMEGYLEGYKKVSGIGIDKKCSYCEERKMPEYEYYPIQYLCKECVEELKSKYPTFGKE